MISRPVAHPLRPPLATGRAAQRRRRRLLAPACLPPPAPTARAVPSMAARPLPSPRPARSFRPGSRFPLLPAEAPARPSGRLRPPVPPCIHPQPPTAAPQVSPPAAVVTSRPNLAGQPAAGRWFHPARSVARLSQTKAIPGQPQPRPGAPLRPATTHPGQPIYKDRCAPAPQPICGPSGRSRSARVPGAGSPSDLAVAPRAGRGAAARSAAPPPEDRGRPVVDREASARGNFCTSPSPGARNSPSSPRASRLPSPRASPSRNSREARNQSQFGHQKAGGSQDLRHHQPDLDVKLAEELPRNSARPLRASATRRKPPRRRCCKPTRKAAPSSALPW